MRITRNSLETAAGAWISCAVALVMACLWLAPKAPASFGVRYMQGVKAPGTPSRYDRVGVLKIGSRRAKNVLVLNPGTSAGSAYFVPLAKTVVKSLPGWQVWSVERRENLLEDQSVLDRAKRGKVTPRQLFDYYLGWLTDSSVARHVQPVPDSSVGFARDWGMKVEVGDLRRVVRRAEKLGGAVVLGGHSLGGTITTAYATWDFNGTPGAKGLSGLVFIDGGSSTTPVTAPVASQELQGLQTNSPWLSFGGIPAPYAGLFADVGAGLAKMAPDAPSILQTFPALPPDLRGPDRVTNEAGFGYAADTKTSPSSLIAFQVHAGHVATSGAVRGWVRGGALTPIQRYATMLSGWGIQGVDGNAWYHPMRLTIDAGAVGDGNANPAQSVLDVAATEGDKVKLPMYAFAAALGDGRVIQATKALAKQSHVPSKDVTIVDRHSTYAHNDPNAAYPRNDFVKHLIPFLRRIAK